MASTIPAGFATEAPTAIGLSGKLWGLWALKVMVSTPRRTTAAGVLVSSPVLCSSDFTQPATTLAPSSLTTPTLARS